MTILERLGQRAAALPAVELAVVFGSAARGEAGPRSDVDLGVRLDPDTPDRRSEAEAELGRAAGRPLDLVFLDQAPPLLRFEIARDGVPVLERRPYLWADFKAKAMIDWWDWAPTARWIHAAAAQRLRDKVSRGPG
jgi:uncharacterized protein